jgi:hypothetical protein
MADDKTLSEYKQKLLEEEQKEYPCGIIHASLEEAMVHAELNLGFRDPATRVLIVQLEPLLGTTKFSSGTIIGWKVGTRKRFRVDFDPDFLEHNAQARARRNGVLKGTQGIHVNEEDFTRRSRQKICHATESSLLVAEHLWRRWTSKYGRIGSVTEEMIKEVDRR